LFLARPFLLRSSARCRTWSAASRSTKRPPIIWKIRPTGARTFPRKADRIIGYLRPRANLIRIVLPRRFNWTLWSFAEFTSCPEHGTCLGHRSSPRRERGIVDFPRYKPLLDLILGNDDTNISLARAHEPGVFDGDVNIFSAVPDEGDQSMQDWRPYVTGEINGCPIACIHQEMMSTESLILYRQQLKLLLETEGACIE